MKPLTLNIALILGLGASTVSAEFLEIEATEIATIEPVDKASPPRILVKWKLPAELSDKIIDAAAIEMPVALSSGDKVLVEVAPLTKDWKATEVEWASEWTTAGGDYESDVSSAAIVTAKNDHMIRANVYLTILEQIQNKQDNFGFIVVPDAGTDARIATVSANDATALSKARLIIAYRDKR